MKTITAQHVKEVIQSHSKGNGRGGHSRGLMYDLCKYEVCWTPRLTNRLYYTLKALLVKGVIDMQTQGNINTYRLKAV